MIGKNVIELNQESVMDALQVYLNTDLDQRVEVVSIDIGDPFTGSIRVVVDFEKKETKHD